MNLRRATPVKPAPTTPKAQAEPAVGRRVKFVMLVLDGDKLSPFATLDIAASHQDRYVEALEAVAQSLPKDVVEVGRPGTRIIVTAVNKQHPNFPVVEREGLLELGEVVTIPNAVKFFSGDNSGDKCSSPLVRYYLDRKKPWSHRGYTFRSIEDFCKDLDGPASDDFMKVAEAHVAWAESNRRTPFE